MPLPYITLAQAKRHLYVDDEAHNADIQFKVEQACGIITDYLKARPIAIASISVANPTVITTSVPHGLISGISYTIGGTTTTPTVEGSQLVTVTGFTTFTVPVNVTVGQTTKAGTVGTPVWTETTAPGHMKAATLLVLTHLHEKRGDDMASDTGLWDAVGRLLMRSRDPALA